MLRRRPALTLTLTMLVVGCRTVPSEIHDPVGSEPVAIDSLARADGRVGPDPRASAHAARADLPDPADRFLADPLQQTTDPDGLTIIDYVLGVGPGAQPGDRITFHYVGSLQDGPEFDSSHSREPFEIEVGGGMMIPGLERGLVGARVGMLRAVTIPPALGYGDRGAGTTIPGGATLVFQIEVLAVEPVPAP